MFSAVRQSLSAGRKDLFGEATDSNNAPYARSVDPADAHLSRELPTESAPGKVEATGFVQRSCPLE